MAQYQDGYFQSIKEELQQNQRNYMEQSLQRVKDRELMNAKILKVVKGVPCYVYTDSNKNVLDIEVCNGTDYATRNEIYNTDPVIFEKYSRGDYRHCNVDVEIKTAIKGRNIDTALTFLDGQK